MGREELQILITGSLNVGKSISEINTQLKGLENKIQKINITASIDKDIIKNLKTISELTKQINQEQAKASKKYIETVTKPDGTKVKTEVFDDNTIRQIQEVKNNTKDATNSFSELGKQTDKTANSFKNANHHAISFTEAFKTALVKFPVWMASSTLFFQSFAFFNEGIAYVNELNKALTEISIVTNKSQAEVNKLGQEYQQLAMEMGVTTQSIAKASVEYYRQGLSQAEVMEKVKTTTQFAAISNLQFKESAEVLTATVNSMGISIKRASDVFALLGDSTATGADEIAKAFQRVGGSAGALDLSFEKTASWIAILSSRTREGAGTIGNSIKSILARIQNLTETGFDEIDGTSINQVAKALAAVDIKLVDSQGQFRNFGKVMDELGAKWSSLDQRTKAYLATTIAGTFQQSRFLNLMEGYQDTIPLYEKALESAGTTQQKFNLYQEGTEAALNRLKTAMQGIWQNTFDSEGIRAFTDALTQLLNLTNGAIQTFGFLPLAIGASIPVLALLSNTIRTGMIANGTKLLTVLRSMPQGFAAMTASAKASEISLKSLAFSFTGLRAAATSTMAFLAGAFLPIAGFMALSFAIEKVTSAMIKNRQEQEEIEKQNQQLIDNYTNHGNKIEELISKYEELTKVKKESGLTSEQQTEYTSLQNELADLLPTLIENYNDKGEAQLKSVEAVRKELELVRQLKDAYQQTQIDNFDKKIDEAINKLKTAREQVAKLSVPAPAIQDEYGNVYEEHERQRHERELKRAKALVETSKAQKELNDISKDFIKITAEQSEEYSKLSKESKKYVDELIKNQNFYNKDDVDKFKENIEKQISLLVEAEKYVNQFSGSDKRKDTLTPLLQNIKDKLIEAGMSAGEATQRINEFLQTQDKSADSVSEAQKIQRSLVDEYYSTLDAVKELNDALDKQNSGRQLTTSEINKLLEKYPELINSLKTENGQLVLNETAIKSLVDAKVNEANVSVQAMQQKLSIHAQTLEQEIGLYQRQVAEIDKVIQKNAELVGSSGAGLMYASMVKSQIEGKQTDANKALQDAKNTAEAIQKAISVGFNFKTSKDSSSSKGSKSEYTALTEDAKNLLSIETQLTQIRSQREGLVESSQEYRTTLQEEAKLIQNKISLLEKELTTVEKTNKIGGKSNAKVLGAKDKDEAFQKANQLKKDISELQSSLSQLSFQQVESETAQYNETISELGKNIDSLESDLSTLSDTSQQYRDKLAEINTQQDLQLFWTEQEITKIKERIAVGKLNDKQLKSEKDRLKELEIQHKKYQNTINSNAIEIQTSKLKEQEEQIESLRNVYEQVANGKTISIYDPSSDSFRTYDDEGELIDELKAKYTVMIDMYKAKMKAMKEAGETGTEAYKNMANAVDNLKGKLNSLPSGRERLDKMIERHAREEEEKVQEQIDYIKRVEEDTMNRLEDLIKDDPAFNFDKFHQEMVSAFADLSNSQGEFVIDFSIDGADTFQEVFDNIAENYVTIKDINVEIDELAQNTSEYVNEMEKFIKDEAEMANGIKDTIAEQNLLLEKKKLLYEQQEKMLEKQIQLLEEEKSLTLVRLQEGLSADIDIDYEALADSLAEFTNGKSITFDGVEINLNDIATIGEVPTDVSTIFSDIVNSSLNMDSNDGAADKIEESLNKQKVIQHEIGQLQIDNVDRQKELAVLEKEKGKDSQEYKDKLKEIEAIKTSINNKEVELINLQKDNVQFQKDLEEIIQDESANLDALREKQKEINDEIRDRETLYKQQKEAIENQIEQIEATYDAQVKVQQEKLDTLDEEIEKEDRLLKLKEKQLELDKVKSIKDHEYIDAMGNVQLTYDKGKAAELEKEIADMQRDFSREDKRKVIQDEIDKLQEEKERKVGELKNELERLQEAHQREIAILETYSNSVGQLISKQEAKINAHLALLEGAFNAEIAQRQLELAEMQAIHAADLAAHQTYITGMENLVSKLENDIAGKIDRLASIFESLIARINSIGVVNNPVPEGDSVSSKSTSMSSTTTSKIAGTARKLFGDKPVELMTNLVKSVPNMVQSFIPTPSIPNLAAVTNNSTQTVSKDTNYYVTVEKVVSPNPTDFLKGIPNYVRQNKI